MNYENVTKEELIAELKKLQLEKSQKNAILNGITSNIAFVGKDLKIIWANQSAAKSVHKSPDEMIGHTCYHFWADPSKPCKNCPSLKALESQKSEHTIIHTPDGRIWEEKGEPVFDTMGNLLGVVEIATDITNHKKAEEELKKNAIRLQSLFEFSPISIWEEDFSEVKEYFDQLRNEGITDFTEYFKAKPDAVMEVASKVKILEINQTSVKLFDAQSKDDIPKNLPLYFNDESREVFTKELIALADGQTHFECEIPIQTPKGDKKDLLLNLSVLPGHETTLSKVIISFIDITDRKLAQELLRESEERYKHISNQLEAILDHIPGLIFYKDKKNNFIRVNKYFSQAQKKNKQDLEGKNLAELYPVDVAQKYYQDDLSVINSGVAKLDILESWETPEGIKWLNTSKIPFVDNTNEIIGVIGISMDITDRKQDQEMLSRSKDQISQLLQTTDQGIYGIGLDGRCTFINNSGLNMLGYQLEECIGRNMHNLIHHSYSNGLPYPVENCPIYNALFNGVGYRIDDEVLWRADGTSFPSEYSSYPIVENKKILGAVVTFSDNTLRKQAEEEINRKNKELVKILAEKNKFFSIIAHDLRSPFHAFLGFTRMMVEDLPSMRLDEVQKIALTMRSSATNLYRLLENLLSWAQMQRGLTPFQQESFALLPRIKEIIQSTTEQAGKKAIEIDLVIPENLSVFADPDMFEASIRNLISNAVKFTNHGGKITILAKPVADNFIEISVSDTGIGMNNDLIRDLFRLDVQTSRKGTDGEPSTGLGLIICKDFIEKNGGDLWVESEEGKGSTFYFTLPHNN
ncbi:MAG: PAS domain S-box protein [Bacteroidota bacterium]